MGGRVVDGFNPFAQYARQIGSCPQTLVVNIKKNISETTTQSLLHEVEGNPTGYFQPHEFQTSVFQNTIMLLTRIWALYRLNDKLYPFKSWLVDKDSQ